MSEQEFDVEQSDFQERQRRKILDKVEARQPKPRFKDGKKVER